MCPACETKIQVHRTNRILFDTSGTTGQFELAQNNIITETNEKTINL